MIARNTVITIGTAALLGACSTVDTIPDERVGTAT